MQSNEYGNPIKMQLSDTCAPHLLEITESTSWLESGQHDGVVKMRNVVTISGGTGWNTPQLGWGGCLQQRQETKHWVPLTWVLFTLKHPGSSDRQVQPRVEMDKRTKRVKGRQSHKQRCCPAGVGGPREGTIVVPGSQASILLSAPPLVSLASPALPHLHLGFLASSSICCWWAKRGSGETKLAQHHPQCSFWAEKDKFPSSRQWDLIRTVSSRGTISLWGDLLSRTSYRSLFLPTEGRRNKSYTKPVEEPGANTSSQEKYINASSARLSFLGGKTPQINKNTTKNHTHRHL